jgi:monodictyphenone polyketide synthase
VFGGLCHAGHVYDLSDAQSIARANTLNCTTSERFFPTIPVLSTSTGKPLPASAALELFENVIAELLIRPITLRNVISGIVGHAAMSRVLQCRVFCVRNSAFIRELIAAMSERMSELRTSTCELMLWFAVKVSRRASLGGSSGPAQSKLAIVGMSCRLPGGANNTEKFWEVLEQQLDVSRKIPADRFDVDTHYDSTGQQLNKTMTQYGCFIDEPGLFDAPFFNMSPREAETIDPQMRLALVTAYEALESAGCIKNRTPSSRSERVGTYYGQAADDYREVNQGQSIGTYYIPGGCRAFGPGRINYFFKFSGPSYSIDTACSSGLAAIEVCGYERLRNAGSGLLTCMIDSL